MQNGIPQSTSWNPPEVLNVDEALLAEEKKSAKYSKSSEYKKLKAHLEQRILFYQQYLPDGRAASEVPKDELVYNWTVANAIIGELKAIILAYESLRQSTE